MIDQQDVTRQGYEIRDAQFRLLGYREKFIDERDVPECRREDALTFARSTRKTCLIIRCADSVAVMAYGHKTGRLLKLWRDTMMPGVARAAA